MKKEKKASARGVNVDEHTIMAVANSQAKAPGREYQGQFM